MSDHGLTVTDLKSRARRLRSALATQGQAISHSESLELLAHTLGARDWNTLRAGAAGDGPRPLLVGARVTGRYLGQPFAGVVHALTEAGRTGLRRITLHFDEPVDVVTFDSFSALRQRVSGVINAEGRSPQKTSDGVPQLMLDL